jgi:hypothetical protein
MPDDLLFWTLMSDDFIAAFMKLHTPLFSFDLKPRDYKNVLSLGL